MVIVLGKVGLTPFILSHRVESRVVVDLLMQVLAMLLLLRMLRLTRLMGFITEAFSVVRMVVVNLKIASRCVMEFAKASGVRVDHPSVKSLVVHCLIVQSKADSL